MHQALYRKWRSKTFDEVVGQDAVTSVLKYQVRTGTVSHAYLFCGSRGTGKTSCAKILARAVNCENPQDGNPCGVCAACRAVENGTTLDVLELDAASNNGVDTIRDIRDEVVYTPSELKCRVYIIDEVHMLSTGAFNALLKTLEEPPSGVVFILATTEMHKLPATIISRCQRFDFRRIPSAEIAGHLMKIASAEGFELDGDAAALIASLASGAMRDAISILELCSGRGERIKRETVSEATGYVGRGMLYETVGAVLDGDREKLFGIVAALHDSSKDIAVFWQELLGMLRDLLVFKTTGEAAKYLDLSPGDAEETAALAARVNDEKTVAMIGAAEDAFLTMQRGSSPRRLIAELALVRMTDQRLSGDADALAARIAALETRLASSPPASASPEKPVSAPANPAPISQKTAPTPVKVTPPPENAAPVAADNTAPAAAKTVAKTAAASFWQDVVKAFSAEEKGTGALLGGTTATLSPDGRLTVYVGADFARMMLSTDAVRERIAAFASRYAPVQTVSVELTRTAPAGSDPIDEI